MLIEFSVTNYRSISERQTLNLAASDAYSELETTNTVADDFEAGAPKLLRSVAVYGPNASGKTTLIRALEFMQDCVVLSAKESQAGESIDTVPFKLTERTRSAPSEFEVTFVEGGVRYNYGFACNALIFTEEWLRAYPNGRPQTWFHRATDDSGIEHYKFSPKFVTPSLRESYRDQTTPNSLFLSRATQLNNQQVKPIFDWFRDRLKIINSSGLSGKFSARRCELASHRAEILAFMRAADLSISGIRIEKKELVDTDLSDEMSSELKELLVKQMRGEIVLITKFQHLDVISNETIEFAHDEMSDGTRALFAFAGPWLDVLEHNKVLVIDELDRHLHPLIVHQLVEQFHNTKSKAQLIFTTHDTTILSQKILRRDQVWLTEKDKGSATRLYPLSDFSIRENEAIEKGYLAGRYGGIPILSKLDFYESK